MTDVRRRPDPGAPPWTHQRRRRRRSKRPKSRYDIQGLRAIAVATVVLNHYFGWPGGGFVGVDIFFVVSGFLITGLLLREHENTDTISWTGFYRRRARRILPAAVLVLVVTVLASWLTFGTARFRATVLDAVSALLFASNWRFEHLATDYFAAERAVSPVQHYWSLSIEEQFYFVWPWLMLAVLVIATRRRWSSVTGRVAVGAVIGSITIASFVYAVIETEVNVAGAYFSTFTRVWELGVGAALAVAIPLCARIPSALRAPLAWLGLLSMLASVWFVDSSQGFPAPAAAWPVLSVALVIAAGTGIDQQRYFAPVTNRAMRYVGDVSYSLYLWHFPVLVIGTATWGDSTLTLWLLLAAAVVLSVYAYELVENPIRRSSWLEPGTRHRKRKDGWALARPKVSQRYLVTLISFAGVVVLVLAGLVLRPDDGPRSALDSLPLDSPSADVDPSAPSTPEQGPRLAALQAQLQRALSDTDWPDGLRPSMDDAVDSPIADKEISDCAAYPDGPAGPQDCAWGPADAKHTAVLVGDSLALSFAGALREATVAHGWRFLSRAATACPFADVAVNVSTSTANDDCPTIRKAAIRDIKAVRPDVLFIVNHEWAPPNPPDDWAVASRRELAKLGDAVGRVVFVGGLPPAPDPEECFTRTSTPVDCTGGPTEAWTNMLAVQQTLAAESGGLFVATEDWFCYRQLCPPYAAGVPIRPDAAHVLPAYLEEIQDAIRETLDRAGVFTT